jgi:hypothetical protein
MRPTPPTGRPVQPIAALLRPRSLRPLTADLPDVPFAWGALRVCRVSRCLASFCHACVQWLAKLPIQLKAQAFYVVYNIQCLGVCDLSKQKLKKLEEKSRSPETALPPHTTAADARRIRRPLAAPYNRHRRAASRNHPPAAPSTSSCPGTATCTSIAATGRPTHVPLNTSNSLAAPAPARENHGYKQGVAHGRGCDNLSCVSPQPPRLRAAAFQGRESPAVRFHRRALYAVGPASPG